MQPKIKWGELLQAFFKALRTIFSKPTIVVSTTPSLPAPTPEEKPKVAPNIPFSTPVTISETPVSTGFLTCPIQANDTSGKSVTAYTAQISAIIDHSDTAIDPTSSKRWGVRAKDQTVKAFNGEIGDGEASAGPPYGYAKKMPEPFFTGKEINYIGAGGVGQVYPRTWYLQYDGHAGYDFPYPRMTAILATADGELHKAADTEDSAYGQGWNKHHTFYIKHKNGLSSWYRHCTKLVDEIEAQIGSENIKSCLVSEGQVVAYVGDFGFPGSVHLHFEVHDVQGKIVDPYGDKLWS